MEKNESPQPKNNDGSHTTFKALGFEFSGPTWLAIIFFVAVISLAILFGEKQFHFFEPTPSSPTMDKRPSATRELHNDKATAKTTVESTIKTEAPSISEETKKPNAVSVKPSAPSISPTHSKIPFFPSLWIGMTKAEVTAALGGGVEWRLSGDSPPLEYASIKNSFAGLSSEVFIFIRSGQLALAKTTFGSHSLVSTTELRHPSPSVQPITTKRGGVSEESHLAQCKQYYDHILSALLTTHSAPLNGFPETVVNNAAEVEKQYSDDKVDIENALFKTRSGVFQPSPGWSQVGMAWGERTNIHKREHYWSGGAVNSNTDYRAFSCELVLQAT
ncbi:MAG: hypothetical protein K0M66_13600 [Thiobacillus sp.]|nr:hypothetical protein [Thiobacillus sp.]